MNAPVFTSAASHQSFWHTEEVGSSSKHRVWTQPQAGSSHHGSSWWGTYKIPGTLLSKVQRGASLIKYCYRYLDYFSEPIMNTPSIRNAVSYSMELRYKIFHWIQEDSVQNEKKGWLSSPLVKTCVIRLWIHLSTSTIINTQTFL